MVRLFVVLAATLRLTAQQPPGEPTANDAVIRVSVHQVLVPVVVTDKKGHHVSGLHASDFRLFEDGVPQEVAAFSTGAAATVDDMGALSKPASEPAAPSPSGPRRTFVICIDTLHASPRDNARLRDTLENLFREEKGTNAQYVVIAIGRHLQVLQTATTNALAIAAKIRTPGFLEALGGRDAAAFSTALRSVNSRMEEFCRSCSCGSRSSQRSCDTAIDTLKQSIDAEAAQWTPLVNEMAGEFKSVVAELAKLPTARTLLLVSGGFSFNPKREFYAAVAASLPARPQFSAGGIKDPEPILEEALKIAAARNVTIFGIDSRGESAASLAGSASLDASTSSGGRTQSVIQAKSASVRTTALDAPGHTASASPPASITMEQLANATGGVYFHDSKDLLKQFRSAMADGREYYILVYVPKNGKGAEGTYRKIAVEVAGKNLNTRAKAGYWADASAQ